MRSDAIGIPSAHTEPDEDRYQPPPLPMSQKTERCRVWNRFDREYLRSRACTLAEMEAFLASAREVGAPDDAVLFQMPDLIRVGWYEE